MWFTLSLLTAFAWAGSDIFSKRGTRPDDRWSHLRLIVAVGTVMGLHAAVSLLISGESYDPANMLRYLPVSAMYILSMALGYVGLRYIRLSVSSPICNSSGAVTAILCAVFLGQSVRGLQLLGVILVCLGVFGLSLLEKLGDDRQARLSGERRDKKYTVSAVAVVFPLLYCVIDGLGSFMDAWYLENLMSETQANYSYEFTFFACAVLAFCYLRFVKKQRLAIKSDRFFGLAAICETAGQLAYVYAMSDRAIVAAPLISSYSIISVLLSRVFLKEKLGRAQYAVIVVVIAGVAILGFFDA